MNLRRICFIAACVLSLGIPAVAQSVSTKGSLTSNAAVALNVVGKSTATITVTGTYAGTLNFEGFGDVRGAAFPVTCTNKTNANDEATTTTTGTWVCQVAGLSIVDVRMSGYTSGTANVFLSANNSVNVNVSGSFGNVTVGDVGITSFPSNVPFDVAQIGGVAVDIGSGNVGTGTQRIVVATDQPPIPMTATSLPLPAGAATSANQSTGNASIASIDGKLPATAALADNVANPSLSKIGSFMHVFDGSGWDRWTGAVTQGGTWTMQPGNTANTTPWLFSLSQGGNTASVNASGQLSITCANCSGTGASLVDNATFTGGTDSVAPSGFLYDTTPPTVTDGHLGAPRMSSGRIAYTTLAQEDGTPIPMTDVGSGAVGSNTDRTVTATDSPDVVTLGATTDAKSTATDTTSVSIVQILKEISAMEQAPASRAVTNAGTFATQSTLQSGTNLIGSVVPYAGGALKSGAITSAMTGTTSTQVIAAVASNYLYITHCSLSNDHASVDTRMQLQDGSGGTVIWGALVPHGGGREVDFPVPLKVPTQGNGLFVVNVTTGSSTYASCNGYASTVSR